MGVKPDTWIVAMARDHRMIEPFVEELVRGNCLSYGPSSYGYDFRVSRHFKLLQETSGNVLDPKQADPSLFLDVEADTCIIPPRSFVLARSLEYFRIPRDILTICAGKSSYARCGVFVNVTPFEPEWEGFVTMSIANLGPHPVRIHAGEGIAQVVFISADEVCRVSYRDRGGKYQAQQGIVLSRVERDETRES